MKRRREQRRSPSSLPRPLTGPLSDSDGDTSSDELTYVQLHNRMRKLGHELAGQSSGVMERLCQEVASFTQGYASLQLYQQSSQKARGESFPASSPRYSVPVQCFGRDYGNLVVLTDPAQPFLPRMTPSMIQIIAEKCADLLYQLEVHLHFRYQAHIDVEKMEPLSTREQEVLELMCLGYRDNAIAQTLHIDKDTVRSHRGNIYNRLHVHARHQAITAGFAAALYSPIEGLAPRLSFSPERSHLT